MEGIKIKENPVFELDYRKNLEDIDNKDKNENSTVHDREDKDVLENTDIPLTVSQLDVEDLLIFEDTKKRKKMYLKDIRSYIST